MQPGTLSRQRVVLLFVLPLLLCTSAIIRSSRLYLQHEVKLEKGITVKDFHRQDLASNEDGLLVQVVTDTNSSLSGKTLLELAVGDSSQGNNTSSQKLKLTDGPTSFSVNNFSSERRGGSLGNLELQYGFHLPRKDDLRFKPRPDSYLGPIGTVTRLPNSTARLIVINGFPMCEWTNVCMDSTSLFRHVARRGKANEIPSEPAALVVMTMKRAGCWPPEETTGIHKLHWWSENDVFNYSRGQHNDTVFIPGRTFIMNTYVQGPQFGHVGAKVMQFFHVKDVTFYDQIMMHTQSRYPSSHRSEALPLTQLVKVIAGPVFYNNLTNVIAKQDVQQYQLVCFEKTYEIRNVFERIFATREQIPKWLEVADQFLDSNSSTCPDVLAPVVLLQRHGGQGKRRIVNFDTQGMAILKELGVICNESDVKRPVIHAGVSLKEQARVFRNAGLLFSSHSSQLRNTIWSHPLSATMELRPHGRSKDVISWLTDPYDTWHRYPTPFCAGNLCVPRYKVSLRHDSAAKSYRADFNLTASLFRSHLTILLHDLKTAMTKQGCPLYNFFNASRCNSSIHI